jgi:hypothetical protein
LARIGFPKLIPTRRVPVGAKEESEEESSVFMVIEGWLMAN